MFASFVQFILRPKFIVLLVVVMVVGGVALFYELRNAPSGENRKVAASDTPFTMVVLPDTQVYSEGHPEIFQAQTGWIVKNKNVRNIVYVTHLGDIVNNPEDVNQWQHASKAMQTLDGKIPYGIAPGNHDMNADGSSPLYDEFFPVTRLSESPGVQTLDGSSRNMYRVFSAAGERFIVFNLEFCPPDNVLEWVSMVLEQKRDYHAIVATHSFLNAAANRETALQCDPYHSKGKNNGHDIWQKLIVQDKRQNILLFLNGHDIWTSRGAARRTDVVNGSKVHQLLSDYQHLGMGGDGNLRILTFNKTQNTIGVETYSPYLDTFMTDPENKFVLPWR